MGMGGGELDCKFTEVLLLILAFVEVLLIDEPVVALVPFVAVMVGFTTPLFEGV